MGVELIDAARLERLLQAAVERLGKRGQLRRDGWQLPNGGDVQLRGVRAIEGAPADSLQRRVERPVAPRNPRERRPREGRLSHAAPSYGELQGGSRGQNL